VRATRAIIFLPQILPLVAMAIAWRWIYAPEGPLNTALVSMGAGGLSRGWLADYSWALIAVGSVATWVTTGFCMVLFFAGIQHIPIDLYDAAKVDGAAARQTFRHVTVPGLRNEIFVAVVVTSIAAFRSFDVIYVMTKGGPGTSTVVPAWQVWRRAFYYGEIGSAAALGVTIAAISLAVVVVLSRLRGLR
jgi:raffinose/stachyose/melibiose transport system permease protein